MLNSQTPSWFTQRVTSFSLLLLIVLCYFALWHDRPSAHDTYPATLTRAQLIFVCYDLFVHALAALFPLRLCWSMWSLTRRLRIAFARAHSRPRATSKAGSIVRQKSISSEYGYESGTSSDSDDSELTFSSETGMTYNARVIHAVLIPNYKEDMDTLRETLEVLAHHELAKTCYDVRLAVFNMFNFFATVLTLYLWHRSTLPWSSVKLSLPLKAASW